MAAQRVRGILFVDYVRMVRAMKDVDWSKYLEGEDIVVVSKQIDPNGWYPMSTFERLGIGILHEVARGQLEGVRMWGRFQVDAVKKQYPQILSDGDPRETLMRFDVLAGSFFDPQAIRVQNISDDAATISIDYGMSDLAEETACHQTMGFFERLAEIAGAKSVSANFKTKAWAGADTTLLKLHWDLPDLASWPPRQRAKR